MLVDTFQSNYSATSTTLWLVDDETNQPIQGAIVTANWELVTGSLAGGAVVRGQMKVMETRSGQDGKVYLPAWGPEPNRYGGHIREADPQIFIYKAGYTPVRLSNFNRHMNPPDPKTPGGYSHDALRHSLWDGETLKLRKTARGKYTYLDTTLDGIRAGLDFALSGSSCDWNIVPSMTAVLLSAQLVQRENLHEDRCGTLRDVPLGEAK